MIVLGLEFGLGNLGFSGLLVTGVFAGIANFNAIDENTCLKRPRVSIRCLYLPEVHRSVFPVSLNSTSLQTHTHHTRYSQTLKRRCCSVDCAYGNKRRQLFLFCFNFIKNQERAVCLQLRKQCVTSK
jgi:hypothetical protein